MYKCINGYTKETMKKQISKYNDGSRSTDEDNTSCVYLDTAGNRCTIGCFIPDNHTGLHFGMPAKSLIKKYPDLAKFMPIELDALNTFQRVHDNLPSGKDLKTELFRWIDKNVE